jgi:hypothetical protein
MHTPFSQDYAAAFASTGKKWFWGSLPSLDKIPRIVQFHKSNISLGAANMPPTFCATR